MPDIATRLISLLAIGFLFVSFALALSQERPAKLLTPPDGWIVRGVSESKVRLSDFPEQFRQIRRSTIESEGGQIFRTWTPSNGIVPLEVISPPFRPARFMSIAITGGNRTADGVVETYIECESNGQRLEVFRGSVNVNVAEAIVVAPQGWCPANARLKLISAEKNNNVGVGAIFEISYLSYLKSTFVGRLPYFLTALAVFSLVMFAGTSVVARLGWHVEPLPMALASLGGTSLAIFYLASGVVHSGIPPGFRWISIAVVAIATGFALTWSGRTARAEAARALVPYAQVWALASLVYFAVLGLTTNGLGHWEPNYRFWPATWSSDNELPWIFAEAIRHGWDLKGLFGGGWIPTDRPPLMAGAHLLLADLFTFFQVGNDGFYLRGQAYNAVAVALNALWVPASWWLLGALHPRLSDRGRTAILVLVGGIPFVLFNTVYGWPKVFGAAFGLLAFGLAWQVVRRDRDKYLQSTIVMFFVMSAFSMLAHASAAAFLAPLVLLFLWWSLRKDMRSTLIAASMALVLLGSWSLYKSVVLPSSEPLTKYALTGDYGFGHPEWSVWHMVSTRYQSLELRQWVEIKKIMLLQSFLPVDHTITQIELNSDFGAGMLDKLRAWDFMLLSKGNLALPFMVLLAIGSAFNAFVLHRQDEIRRGAPFLVLIGISAAAWLLMVLSFLIPIVLHHWPEAALFGLALGGAAVVHERYPFIFKITFVGMMAYVGLVWILSPIQSALGVDAGAAFVLTLLVSWGLISALLPRPAFPKENHLSSHGGGDFSVRDVLIARRTNRTVQRIAKASVWRVALRALAGGALLFATYITFRYIDQPLADAHAFRQTQTALTAYWMLKEGWALAYQTPVTGFPWSIPFEFPIYQTVVAAIVALTGFDLAAVGRFVSFVFLVACAWPAFALSRRLELPKSAPWVFCALMWTSPLTVYWGRTFMIETAALFFSFACIPYAIDLTHRVGGWRSAVLFVVLATAGVLQKATTGGPVLLFLLLASIFLHFRKTPRSFRNIRRLLYPVVLICIPLVVGFAWSYYTDVVKEQNPFGVQLTSKALAWFNFGDMRQRLDFETWRLIIWERSLGWNAGGWIGVSLLLLPWFSGRQNRRFAWLSFAAIILFLLPLLTFTNLHVVHEYYQVACVPFLLAAIAIVIGGWLEASTGTTAMATVMTFAIILSNLTVFNSTYGVVAARSLDELDSRSVQAYKVGRYLRDQTPPGTGLVVFGQDYSSEIAFQSQRKTMTVPPWFKQYHQLWEQPQSYLGDVKLAAIVICPRTNDFPNVADLEKRLTQEPAWIHVNVEACELLLSPKTLAVH